MDDALTKEQLEEIGIIKDNKLTSFGSIFLVMVTIKTINKVLFELCKELNK